MIDFSKAPKFILIPPHSLNYQTMETPFCALL